jgi:hypothetical protein
MNQLTHQIIVEARRHLGVREVGKNDGPEVSEWLRRVLRAPGNPWCAAFAWCMLDDACKAVGVVNPLEPCAGAHLLMVYARQHRAWGREAGPGYLFAINHGRSPSGARIGHVGIVVDLDGDKMTTIEGNTDDGGGREGQGVYQRTRQVSEATLGFLDPGLLITRG